MSSVEEFVDRDRRIGRIREILQKQMAPPGSLGLPDFLDKRRLEFLVPDEAFEVQPIYDRCWVLQKDDSDKNDGKFMKDGLIERANVFEDKAKRESPFGVLIAAGPLALDGLMSQGIALGHIVSFTEVAPWKLPLGRVGEGADSIEYELVQIRSGDICGSQDLAKQLREGKVKIERRPRKDAQDAWEHVFVDEAGTVWNPLSPYFEGSM